MMNFPRYAAILDVRRPTHKDDDSASQAVKTLRKYGFKVSTGHSPYVGSTAVILTYTRLIEIRSALRILKEFSYITNIERSYKGILDNIRRGCAT